MEDLEISSLRPCLCFIEVDSKTGQDVKVIENFSLPATYKRLHNLQRDFQRDADSGDCLKYWQSTRLEGAREAYSNGNKIAVRIGMLPFSKDSIFSY